MSSDPIQNCDLNNLVHDRGMPSSNGKLFFSFSSSCMSFVRMLSKIVNIKCSIYAGTLTIQVCKMRGKGSKGKRGAKDPKL